jgi:hypothetical protein
MTRNNDQCYQPRLRDFRYDTQRHVVLLTNCMLGILNVCLFLYNYQDADDAYTYNILLILIELHMFCVYLKLVHIKIFPKYNKLLSKISSVQ